MVFDSYSRLDIVGQAVTPVQYFKGFIVGGLQAKLNGYVQLLFLLEAA